jgi:O-antigen ligase
MTARLHAPQWVWLAGLAFLASIMGLLAGVSPGRAIGLAAAFGFVLLTVTNLALAESIFCAEPLRLDFDESGVIRLAAVLLLLAWFGALVARDHAKKDFLSVHPGMSLVLGLFVGWSVLSATWAEIPSKTLTPDGGFALGVALILITFTAVGTRDQALLATAVFVAGAAAAALYAIVSTPPPEASQDRLSATFLDPNELASTLVAGAALAIGVARFAKRSPGLRLAAYGACALCLLGIFLSVSRGGLVALGVALIAAVLVGGRFRLRIGLLAVAVAVAAIYYFAALAPQAAKERILQSTQSGAVQREGRASIWQIGWRMVEANPVQGVGSGNFTTASRHYLLQPGTVWRSDEIIEKPKVAHNTFLGMWAELGIVGLLLFLAVIVFSLRSALLAARNFAGRGDRDAEILARTLAIALVGMLAASFFISQPLAKQLWFLLGLGPALLAISSRKAPAAPAA